MGLGSVLSTALSGLTSAQSQIDVVSQNVANKDSVGYTRRTASPIQQVSGERTTGVKTTTIERVLDQLVQSQLITENAGAGYASVKSNYTAQIDQVFGQPNGAGSLDTLFNTFTSSLQTLAANPSDTTARSQVVANAQVLASQLNSASNTIQLARTDTENAIADAVSRANEALAGIEKTSNQLASGGAYLNSAALLDQRDQYIADLSKIVDITVTQTSDGTGQNQISIVTNSGAQLFDGRKALNFSFSPAGTLSANDVYDTNPALSGVGQLSLVNGAGLKLDVVAQGLVRGGELAGLLDARDNTLPQAQRQLDDLAAGLSSALSDRNPTPTAVPGPPAGYDIDLTGLQQGNVTTIDFTDATNTARRVQIVRVDSPTATLPASNATSDPNAIVVRVDSTLTFSAADLATLTAAGLSVSNTGNILHVLPAGGAPNSVNAVSAGITVTTLNSGYPETPLFVDGLSSTPFTGSYETGSQRTGFSSRIRVNPNVTANTATLVQYNTPAQPTTQAGDNTRPQLLADRLTQAQYQFSAASGIGGSNAAFTGSVADFARAIVNDQGGKAAQATRLNDGQQVVVNTLQAKFAATSGVNVDQELSDLIKYQNAYSANARIISVVKDLLDVLLRI